MTTSLRTTVRNLAMALAAALTLAATVVVAGPGVPRATAKSPALAATPLMGWSSWSHLRKEPTYAKVKDQADALLANGLDEVGYDHVNLDDFYYACKGWAPAVDSYGRWVTDKTRFPDVDGKDGLRALADYVHGKGLKFGLYMTPGISMRAVIENTPIEGTDLHARDIVTAKPGTDPSTFSSDSDYYNGYYRMVNYGRCGSMAAIDFTKPGAQEFIDSWARKFESLGADYLKLDGVGADSADAQVDPELKGQSPGAVADVRAWSEALDTLEHPIHLELSNKLPMVNAAAWARYAHGWRTQKDVECYSSCAELTKYSMVATRFDSAADWQSYAGPGGWNDLDSMQVGGGATRSGLNTEESKTQITLWAMAASPLILGADLTALTTGDLTLLKNRDVIAVDQDGVAATRMVRTSGTQVFVKRERSGAFVLALFNTGDAARDITVSLTDAGLSGAATLTDLWAGTSAGTATGTWTAASVPAHGVRLVRAVPAPTTHLATTVTTGRKCLTASSSRDVAPAVTQTCDGRAQQLWTATVTGQLRVGAAITQCLDVSGSQTAAGTRVILYHCKNGTNQQWTVKPDGTVVGVQSGRCLTDTGVSGAGLEIRDCTGAANQQWAGLVRYTAEAESSANTLAGGAVRATCATCSNGARVGYLGEGGTLTFTGVRVPASGTRTVRVWYTNGDASRSATLSVNGAADLTLTFGSTGGWRVSKYLEVRVPLAAGSNSLRFANQSGWAPDIDRIDIVG